MRHLLIDFDSTIPNLALMKISAWAKARGDQVYLNDDSVEPDEIWLSCLFTWNANKAKSRIEFYKYRFPNARIHYGGTGFDFFLEYKSPEWERLIRSIIKPVIESRQPGVFFVFFSLAYGCMTKSTGIFFLCGLH